MIPKWREKGIENQLYPCQGRGYGKGGLELLYGQVCPTDEGIDQDQVPEMVRPSVGIIRNGETRHGRGSLQDGHAALSQEGVGQAKLGMGTSRYAALGRARIRLDAIQDLLTAHSKGVGVGVSKLLFPQEMVQERLPFMHHPKATTGEASPIRR